MENNDPTLTTPSVACNGKSTPILVLSVLWHSDLTRIGGQYVVTTAQLELNRFMPLFHTTDASKLALGYSGISREPVRIVRAGDELLEIYPPQNSHMVLEMNGVPIQEPCVLDHTQIAHGALLGLGRAVLLCVHWMRTLPKHNPIPGLLGIGQAAVKLRDVLRQVAASDLPALLLGETGTGKEVVAKAIHSLSRRSHHPLISVNMAALNVDRKSSSQIKLYSV